jgi:hypothetical protein
MNFEGLIPSFILLDSCRGRKTSNGNEDFQLKLLESRLEENS